MIIEKINKASRILRNTIIELFQHPIIINASLSINKDGEVYHFNWGDDINSFFLKEISYSPVILYHECLLTKILKKDNYVVIGSTIDMLVNNQSIVWGAGLMNEHPINLITPKKIYAVRGPKTREVLLEHGIECPEVYGDPALLIPLYYKPLYKTKKFKLGIIPHYTEISFIPKHLSNNKEVNIINVNGYSNWLEFIEKINECEYIISSSLHGLIISEGYGIPNQWIEFKEAPRRSRFKYDDFYASIKKENSPLIVDENSTLESLLASCQSWKSGEIDLQPLFKACPFKLKLPLNEKQ